MKKSKILSLFALIMVTALCFFTISANKTDAATYSFTSHWQYDNSSYVSASFDESDKATKFAFSGDTTVKLKKAFKMDGFTSEFVIDNKFDSVTFKFLAETLRLDEYSELADAFTIEKINNEGKLYHNKEDDETVKYTFTLNDTNTIKFNYDFTNQAFEIFVNSTDKVATIPCATSEGYRYGLGKLNITADLNDKLDNSIVKVKSIAGESFVSNASGELNLTKATEIVVKEDTLPKKYLTGVSYKINYTAITMDASTSSTLSYKVQGVEDSEYKLCNNNSVMFTTAGTYTLKIETSSSNAQKQTKTFDITVEAYDESLSFVPTYDNSKNADYQTLVDGIISDYTLKKPLTLPVPFVSDTLSNAESMNYTIYYKLPSARTWTKNTDNTLTFTPSTVGRYFIKVQPANTLGHKTLLENCPEFTFVLRDNELPKISFNSSFPTKVTIDKEASLNYISITDASAYHSTYKLEYYNEKTSAWEEVEGMEDLKFTPNKLGRYRLTVTTTDAAFNSSVESKEFTCVKATKTTEEKQLNTMSIVFLCIAAASLLGIIAIIFIKPKDTKNSPKFRKKTANDENEDAETEQDEEVVEEDEEIESSEEEIQETTETEEVEESTENDEENKETEIVEEENNTSTDEE